MKSFPVFLLCAIAFIALVAVQPVMAVVDMDPFDSSVPEASLNPFSNDIAEPTGTYDWFYGPDQTQMSDYLAYLGIPYYDDSGNWVIDPAMQSSGGSTWDPNANFEVPKLSPALPDWSGEYVPQVGTGGWYSPLTPSGIPVSPTASPTSAPVGTGGWFSPLTPSGIPVAPTASPTPTPTPTLTPGAQGDEPQISITSLNLQGEYLTIRNNGMTPVAMTGWTITNGQGKSLTFIDWPRGDGSTFTFVLSPQSTVTVYYGREGTVTATELYWPSGEGTWSRPGDTAYLYNPQGSLVSSLTA